MKKITYLLSIILGLLVSAFFVGCDPEPEKEQLILRMYSPDVAQAELLYLSKLDPKTLSPEELKEKETREGDIGKLINDMLQTNLPYGTILESVYGIRPPGPTPCPDRPDILGCLEPDIPIQLFELGILHEVLPETAVTRADATPEPSVIIQSDPQHIFAIGKLKSPADMIFKTARFTFAVVDSSLEGKDMVMIITTTILKDGKEHAVELKIPVLADTFSAD